MTEDIEEAVPLTLTVANIPKNNQVGVYFNIKTSIQTINRTGLSGNVALSLATLEEFNDIQVFLTNNALQALTNISYPLTPYDASRMDQLHNFFLQHWNLFDLQQQIIDDDYIEWSLVGDNLLRKRQEFREQIDLYKTYDNEHHSITRLLIEIIDYYIKEYLAEEEHFTANEITKLEGYFQQAIREKNYLKYFVKVYTLSNHFHRILNKHLALYILDYFDIYSYSHSSKGHRLINCLVYIVTLLINHPDIHKHQYKGVTYRGILMTEEALNHYSVGNHILNRSFVSTTKERAVAEIFSGSDRANLSRQTPDDHSTKKVSVLLKYTTKQDRTAIDIKYLSTIPDEEEVLILPFSVFQVKDRIDNCSTMRTPVLVEIDLEECEDDESMKSENEKGKQETKLKHQTTKKKRLVKSKCFWGSLGLCFIICLIITGGLLVKLVPALSKKSTSKGSNNGMRATTRISGPVTLIHWNPDHWAHGCDFHGNDLNTTQVRGSDCGPLCRSTPECTHFTWTTDNNGTCKMKQGSVSKSNAVATSDITTLCGVITTQESRGNIYWKTNWAHACKFPGNDLSNIQVRADECGGRCSSTPGCTHFTWTTGNGGTCWMKQGPVSKSDALLTSDQTMVCGVAVSDAIGNTIDWKGNWAQACEFRGNDLTNVQIRGEDCSQACADTSQCTHFTWTTHNVGTCWMKQGPISRSDAIPTSDQAMVCGVPHGW